MSIHALFGASKAKVELPYDAKDGPIGVKQNALFVAVTKNDFAGVDRALANGADLDVPRHVGLQEAYSNDQLKMVKYLFQKGLKPYKREVLEALNDELSKDTWNLDKIKFLLDNGVQPSPGQFQMVSDSLAWWNPNKGTHGKDAKDVQKLITDAYNSKSHH